MTTKSRLKFFTILFVFLFANAGISTAQTTKTATPRQEKLLNGMKLLVWNDPTAPKVSVKLRVHSGSAFDPLGKEGTMAMLADILFPTDAAKEFFTEDLGGSLDVASSYDYIQITATANSDQFLTMLETVANAVINAQTDKETTAKVRAAHLEKIRELEKNPAYIADRAAAKLLFGDFPYGRPQMGTSESIAKIDFADLTLAKQRFLTADNATLAVVGNVKPDLAYRAARRYFGAWTQADKKVPATFRQPDAPDTKQLVIENPNVTESKMLFAVRGLAKNDKDYVASKLLLSILENRLRIENSIRDKKYILVREQPFLLSGLIIFDLSSLKATTPAEKSIDGLFNQKITDAEFEQARITYSDNLFEKDFVNNWLDLDTYPLSSSHLSGTKLKDVQRIAENLQKQPIVSVLVKKPESAENN